MKATQTVSHHLVSFYSSLLMTSYRSSRYIVMTVFVSSHTTSSKGGVKMWYVSVRLTSNYDSLKARSIESLVADRWRSNEVTLYPSLLLTMNACDSIGLVSFWITLTSVCYHHDGNRYTWSLINHHYIEGGWSSNIVVTWSSANH